jgi:hypothetical protein
VQEAVSFFETSVILLPPTPKSTVKKMGSFETPIIFTSPIWYVISPPAGIMNCYLLCDGNIILTSNFFFAHFFLKTVADIRK